MFSLHTFRALSAERLHDYMEPLLASPALEVCQQDISEVLSGITTFDEYHITYALLLGERFAVSEILAFLPQMLVHQDVSVFCTALNILQRLPKPLLLDDFLCSLREVADHPMCRPVGAEAINQIFQNSEQSGERADWKWFDDKRARFPPE